MRIVTIIGARPQFIKASVVSKSLKKNGFEEIIIHTGQHFDNNMSEIFFQELNMSKPDFNLNIGGASHGSNTGRMMEKIEELLLKLKPKIALVYGDTDSTLAGALVASKLHIPVAHVEAGLRSFNKKMPEEINRILTDHMSSILFVPTVQAKMQLDNEGIKGAYVKNVGDVMYDALIYYGKIAEEKSKILIDLKLKVKSYNLLTIHRAENVDNRDILSSILKGLELSDQKIILPLHPRTKLRLIDYNLKIPSNVKLIPPIGYLDMIMLEKNASLICTDSGGVQKEAFFQKVPCVTLRSETEWVELVELGWNKLVDPSDSQGIAEKMLKSVDNFGKQSFPYGNGNSSLMIAETLKEFFR